MSRDFVAGHKRRRMTDAMAELCAERGYEATKIADVVSRAGVARKTLYDNFGGKEALLLAALEECVAEMRAVAAAACAGAGEGEARIEAGIQALFAHIEAHPAQARMCMVEALSATPASAARYDEAIHDFIAMLSEATPAAPGLPSTTAETLVGGVAWILQQRLRRGESERVAELAPELTEFVLSPYRGVGKPGD